MDRAFSTVKNMIARGDHEAALSQGREIINRSPHKLDLLIDLGNLALEVQRFDDAAAYFREAIELQPNRADFYNSLGTASMLNGQLSDAVDAFESALLIKPDYLGAKFNLAVTQKKMGDLEKALTTLEEISKTAGDAPPLLSELADTYDALGDVSKAIRCYHRLLSKDAQQDDIRLRLVDSCLRAGNADEAFHHARFFEGSDDRTDRLSETAYLFFRDGYLEKAAHFFQQALSRERTHARARLGLSEIYRRQVPRWHFPMLNDETRNNAYDAAITRAIKPGDIVLDIGAGSGLLAMMAARAGAKHVYSCEAESLIAEKAREIIATNGFSEKITILPLRSTTLKIGDHLPQKADVLISEILDRLLIGEGMLPTLKHALTHLVKDDAAILPKRGRLFACPIESEAMHHDDRCHEAAGFDVSAFNTFANHGVSAMLKTRQYEFRELGPTVELFDFDFTTADQPIREREIPLSVTEDGTCHGVLIWFEVDVDDAITLNNHPQKSEEHWGFSASIAEHPFPVTKGDVVPIRAHQYLTSIDVQITSSASPSRTTPFSSTSV